LNLIAFEEFILKENIMTNIPDRVLMNTYKKRPLRQEMHKALFGIGQFEI